MTIRELYEWAENLDALDINVFKNVNLDIFPVESMYVVNWEHLGMKQIGNDKKVILLD